MSTVNGHFGRNELSHGSNVNVGASPFLIRLSWDRFAAGAVTLGLMLDWVPAYLGFNPVFFSLVKIVVIPTLVLDLVRHPGDYLTEPATRFGRIFLLAYLVGVGGGVLLGTVSVGRFASLAPVVLILSFYLKARVPEETGRILWLGLLGAAPVPVLSILGAMGVISASMSVHVTGVRVLTGVSWSTLGLYGAFIPAAIGGLVFLSPERRIPGWNLTLAAILFASGVGGLLVTGQRSALAAFIVAMLVSVGLYLWRSLTKGLLVVALLGILLVGLGWQFRGPLLLVTSTVANRVVTIRSNPRASGAGLRASFYRRLATDLTEDPAIVAPGVQRFVSYTGNIPHLILGEAYYDGGLVLMLTLLGGVVLGGWRTLWRWWLEPESQAQYGMQLSLWVAFALVLSLHPGLQTRFVYMMLGLWLAPMITSYHDSKGDRCAPRTSS